MKAISGMGLMIVVVISISLTGFAYVILSGSENLKEIKTRDKLSSDFNIISRNGAEILIKNTGSEKIQKGALVVYIDSKETSAIISNDIGAQETGTIYVKDLEDIEEYSQIGIEGPSGIKILEINKLTTSTTSTLETTMITTISDTTTTQNVIQRISSSTTSTVPLTSTTNTTTSSSIIILQIPIISRMWEEEYCENGRVAINFHWDYEGDIDYFILYINQMQVGGQRYEIQSGYIHDFPSNSELRWSLSAVTSNGVYNQTRNSTTIYCTPLTTSTTSSTTTTSSTLSTTSTTLPTSISSSNTSYDVPILVLEYFPNQNGVLRLDNSSIAAGLYLCDGLDRMPLQTAKDGVNLLHNLTLVAMRNGSIYHGYKDPTAMPALNYYAYETKIIEAEHPKIFVSGSYRTDYNTMLNNLNICDYVDNKGVKEVWLWAYCAPIGMWESNMAGPHGDISNSNRDPNDMPICSKTYTLYHYNYGRGVGEAVEDHGHQIESLLGYADYDLFWNKFVKPYGEPQPTINRCGDVHEPPNTKNGYDWFNEADAVTDCEDWKPAGGGATKVVDCHTWSNSINCYSTDPFKDANVGFKIWWMQNIPGKNNNLTYQGKLLRNWWEWKGDFDQAVQTGRSLTIP